MNQLDPDTRTIRGYIQDLTNSAPMIAKLFPSSPNAITPPTQSLYIPVNSDDWMNKHGTYGDPYPVFPRLKSLMSKVNC